MAVADARPLTRPLARRRVSPRALIGAALAVVGVVLLAYVYRSQQPSQTLVMRAVRDVPAGASLRAGDVQAVPEALPAEVAATLVQASDQSDLVGRRVSQPIAAGDFLRRSQVGRAVRGIGPTQRLVTIAVNSGQVAGLGLAPGDRVEIVATLRGRADATPRVVVQQAIVYDTGPHDSGSVPLGGQIDATRNGQASWLAVLVNDDEFQAVAQAESTSDLAVALLASEDAS